MGAELCCCHRLLSDFVLKTAFPTVVQLLLMKYCHYCRIKLVCSEYSQAYARWPESLSFPCVDVWALQAARAFLG